MDAGSSEDGAFLSEFRGTVRLAPDIRGCRFRWDRGRKFEQMILGNAACGSWAARSNRFISLREIGRGKRSRGGAQARSSHATNCSVETHATVQMFGRGRVCAASLACGKHMRRPFMPYTGPTAVVVLEQSAEPMLCSCIRPCADALSARNDRVAFDRRTRLQGDCRDADPIEGSKR